MSGLEQELIELYKDVYCFVNSRINDKEYARDITQTVMETAIDKHESLRKKEALRAWVMQIASNKIKAYYNDLRRINSIFVYQDESSEGCTAEIDNVEDVKSDLLQLLVSRENKINLINALNRLEKKYSEVIRLNYICGYSLVEISELLNVNVNTVRTWSARGLVKLKEEYLKIEAGGRL